MAKSSIKQQETKAPEPVKMHYPMVCADFQRRTCLALSEDLGLVSYIPLSIENGFNVEVMSVKAFSELYKQLADYPPARCAALYAQYAVAVGGSQEALDHLGRLTPLTQKEIDMATAKKTSRTTKAAVDKPAAKAAPKTAAKTSKKPATKAAKTAKVASTSAAQMFKDLIMAGNLTDDKIFEKVQAAFGLDDKRRSYVAWYRKDLAKKGAKPPAAKA